MQIAREYHIDSMVMQETKININSEKKLIQEEIENKFQFNFNSSAQEQHLRSIQINRPGRHINIKSRIKNQSNK